MTTQNIKKELNKDMENPRKKTRTEIQEIKSYFSQTKNTVEGHSSRLEQMEDRISVLEDEIEIKRETKEILVKNSKAMKGICKKSVTPSKDQI
jgi:chromosome segregation ATPase